MKKYIMPAGKYLIGDPVGLMKVEEWVNTAYNTADDVLYGPPDVIMSKEDEEPYLHISTSLLDDGDESFELDLKAGKSCVPIQACVGRISIVSTDKDLDHEWGSWYALDFDSDFEVFIRRNVLYISDDMTVSVSKEVE